MKKILIAAALTLAGAPLLQAQTTRPQNSDVSTQQSSTARITVKEAQAIGATQQQINDLEAVNKDISSRMATASKLKDEKQRRDQYSALDKERMDRYSKILSADQINKWKSERAQRRDTVKSGIERRKQQNQTSPMQDSIHMDTAPPAKQKN